MSMDECERLRERIVELELELARHHRDFERWEEMADKGAAQIEENRRLREEVEYWRERAGV